MPTYAPVAAATYQADLALQPPSGIGATVLQDILDAAWNALQNEANQPLTQATTTDVYRVGEQYANMDRLGNGILSPRYNPIASVTSVKWSTDIGVNGWTASTHFDLVDQNIAVYDNPFRRGDYGMYQVVYVSGYLNTAMPQALLKANVLLAQHYISNGFVPVQGGAVAVLAWIPDHVKALLAPFKRRF